MSLACSNSISRRKSVLVQPAQCESIFLCMVLKDCRALTMSTGSFVYTSKQHANKSFGHRLQGASSW